MGPTGAGDSPYTSESTFAGNPLFLDLEQLASEGLLTQAELDGARTAPSDTIDYAGLYRQRETLLRLAFPGSAARRPRRCGSLRRGIRG